MADQLDAGLVYFRFHSSTDAVIMTSEQAAPLVRQGHGIIVQAASVAKATPMQALSQSASHQRVFATVPSDVVERVRMRIANDRLSFMDNSLSIADIAASLLRDYGEGKISIKGGILKSP